MEWVYGLGVVILIVVGVAIMAAGRGDQPDDTRASDDAEEPPYQWGDELHEYSYRHPWEED